MKKFTKLKEKSFFLGVLLFIALSLISMFTKGQCTDSVASYSNGTTKVEAIIYDSSGSGIMRILYKSVVSSSGKDWSHIGIYVPVCIGSSNWTAGTWTKSGSTYSFTAKKSDYSLGTDASHPSSPYVIKSNNAFSTGTTTQWYVELDTMLQTSCGPMYIKPGSTFETDSIIIPSGSCGPVPVELISFNAVNHGKFNLLTWTTATEIQNKGFEVQRSTDTKNWTTLGMVKTKAEGGNSMSLLSYAYKDEKPPVGTAYYRLHQIDYDGKSEYSWPISVKEKGWYTGPFTVEMYPSPANGGSIIVRLNSPTMEEKNQIQICSADGKKVFSGDFTGTSIEVDVSKLISGIYIVSVSSGGFTETKKLMVQ